MTRAKWAAAVCLVGLLGGLCCSSGSSGGGELKRIEDNVSGALQVMAFILNTLNPFPRPPAPAVAADPAAVVECTDVSQGFCNVSGTVEECTTVGTDIDVDFDQCAGSFSAQGSVFEFAIDGLLTYAEVDDWPSGSADVFFSSDAEGDWDYDMAFDGTDQVLMNVEDLIGGTRGTCVGSLETFVADCDLVERSPL